jgi:hypothetical protein
LFYFFVALYFRANLPSVTQRDGGFLFNAGCLAAPIGLLLVGQAPYFFFLKRISLFKGSSSIQLCFEPSFMYLVAGCKIDVN